MRTNLPLLLEVLRRRNALGLSEGFVASRAGIHLNTLSNYERGCREPGLTKFIALVEALGGVVTITWPDTR